MTIHVAVACLDAILVVGFVVAMIVYVWRRP